ncbi:MAG: tetratricopeptide repeat protein [Bacteroidetes bacterium]|nr:tetratricopeptide repeat protein [Bacteroidota bacterium]
MNYEELQSLLDRARKERSAGKFDISEQFANEVLAVIENSTSFNLVEDEKNSKKTLQVKAILELTWTNYARGNFDIALEQAQRGIALADLHDLKVIKSKAWNILGLVYHSLGTYEKAIEYYNQALEAHSEYGDILGVATLTGNIGNVHAALGALDKALEYYNRAHLSHLDLGDKSGAARVSGNIGIVYQRLGNFEKAIEYYNSALDINKELGEKANIANVTANIGLLYNVLGNHQNSLVHYNNALEIFQEIGDKSGVASVIGNIGGVYFSLGNYEKTLEYSNSALEKYYELGQKSSIASHTGNIGQMYADKKFKEYNPKKAEELLIKAIALSIEIGAKADLVHNYKFLSDLYEKENRAMDALEYFKKYHEVEKEVQSEEATKQAQQLENRRKVEEAERDRQVKLARFQEQEKILHNILPAQIAERILEGEKQIADLHEHVSVFFSDIVGFTQLSQKVTPDELLSMLNEIFSEFDRIARNHGLEKIKTIGDAYMAVAGVPIAQEDHAQRAAAFALEVIEYMKVYRKKSNSDLQIRVGLHCGKAIAGVIGENKFAYDLWGDSVNTASRMESHGEAGRIHVSEDFKSCLTQTLSKGKGLKTKVDFVFEPRGEMDVKGKGKMKTYFLEKES